MKRLLILIMFVGLLMACETPSETTYTAASISPASAYAMLESNPEVILVDVRTESEYLSGHIEGAILLPLDTIETNAGDLIPDKTATYIVYCRSGNRSAQAVDILLELGYQNLYDLGGIIYWPYDIVT